MPEVVSMRQLGFPNKKNMPEGTEYIGRPSKWGNPFHIGIDGTREQVIRKYEIWVKKQPELMSALEELRGKDLVCWCSPLPCHGHVLIKLANRGKK